MDQPHPTLNSAPPPSKRKRKAGSDSKWAEKQGVKCDRFAELRAVVARRGDMLTAWGIVADVTGAEAERQLVPLGEEYRALTLQAAWGIREDGRRRRDFTHWAARSIVALAVFFARNCMPTTWHGQPAYRVAGFTMKFFAMLCGLLVFVDGVKQRKLPSRSTFGHVAKKRPPSPLPDGWVQPEARGWIGELATVGLIEAAQFDACDVTAQQRGPVKEDGTQWAFVQIFLLVRPWPPGLDGPGQLPKKKTTAALQVRNVGRTTMERLQRTARFKTDREQREQREQQLDQPLRKQVINRAALRSTLGDALTSGARAIADVYLAALTPEQLAEPPPD